MPIEIVEGSPRFHSQIPRFVLDSGEGINRAILGRNPESFLSSVYRKKHGYYSYRRSFIAECDGKKAAGCIFALDYAIIKREYIHEIFIHLSHPIVLLRQMKSLLDAEQIIKSVGAGDCYVTHLAVLPEYRSQGLGARLLDKTTDFYRDRGCVRLLLDVDTDNEGGIRFYRRYGLSMIQERAVVIGRNRFHLTRMGMNI
ncbi:MAG: hypothetical protein A2Y33_08855 [Spirochaetes bacterium GWF1_51_8]|nr:MAG: hypothetical protein A2Y33_08855 [Spirochaetes bacterium GWF1_51_8]